MTDVYDKKAATVALTVACPVCNVEPAHPCVVKPAQGRLKVKERPHYSRYELAINMDTRPRQFAEPESKRRLVTLTSSAPANSRDPRQFTLMIEDEETNTVMAFDMDEHQFCLLMSHHVVKLDVS